MSKYTVNQNFTAVIDGKKYAGTKGQTIELSGVAEGRLLTQGIVKPATVTRPAQSKPTTE